MSCQLDIRTDQREILIVDDDKCIKGVLERKLKRKGYQVNIASNGKEALKMIEERRIDILITDFSMPEMNGIQLIREIIRRDLNELMIIMMSSIDRSDMLPDDIKNRLFSCHTKWDISEIIFDLERSIQTKRI